MRMGDAFDLGKVGHSEAYWEEMLGPKWREQTVEYALAKLDDDIDQSAWETAASDERIARYHERARIAETLLAKLDEIGGHVDDAMIAEVTRDLYGESPSRASLDAVLDVVATLGRMRSGEGPAA
jgi:hypothetical protein